MSKTNKIFNIIYAFIVVLFFLDSLTSLNIKSQLLKSFVYFGLIVGTPVALLWNVGTIKIVSRKIILSILPIAIIITILFVGPIRFMYSTGAWHTQTILYQNGHSNFKKIEFQMQDVGSFGYNKRTVEVLYLTPLLMITNDVPGDIEKKKEWIKVDKFINELNLKVP